MFRWLRCIVCLSTEMQCGEAYHQFELWEFFTWNSRQQNVKQFRVIDNLRNEGSVWKCLSIRKNNKQNVHELQRQYPCSTCLWLWYQQDSRCWFDLAWTLPWMEWLIQAIRPSPNSMKQHVQDKIDVQSITRYPWSIDDGYLLTFNIRFISSPDLSLPPTRPLCDHSPSTFWNISCLDVFRWV